jgi:phenylpyruvate tautomerase PptA (4-oxalocrotonate tautomerase family)
MPFKDINFKESCTIFFHHHQVHDPLLISNSSFITILIHEMEKKNNTHATHNVSAFGDDGAMSVIFGIGMEKNKVSVILQNVGAVHYIIRI